MIKTITAILFCVCVNSECKIFDCNKTDITFINGFYDKCLTIPGNTKEYCDKQLMSDFKMFCSIDKTNRIFMLKEKK